MINKEIKDNVDNEKVIMNKKGNFIPHNPKEFEDLDEEKIKIPLSIMKKMRWSLTQILKI